jgi:hypothetical protein
MVVVSGSSDAPSTVHRSPIRFRSVRCDGSGGRRAVGDAGDLHEMPPDDVTEDEVLFDAVAGAGGEAV